jgi:hypothetical protein
MSDEELEFFLYFSWENIKEDTKTKYIEMAQTQNKLFSEKPAKKLSSTMLFLKDRCVMGDKNNLKNLMTKWKNLPESTKKEYEEKSQKFRKELKENDGLTKPKPPMSYLQHYVRFLSNNGELKGKNVFSYSKEMFDKLTDEAKTLFKKRAAIDKIQYEINKFIYQKEMLKISQRNRELNPFDFFIKSLKGSKLESGDTILKLAKRRWKVLSTEEKKKYIEESEKNKTCVEDKKHFNRPRRPPNVYSLFTKEKYKDFPGLSHAEISRSVAKLWKEYPENDKKKFYQDAEEAKRLFTKQLEEFEEKGYFKEYKTNPPNKPPLTLIKQDITSISIPMIFKTKFIKLVTVKDENN